MKLLLLTIYSLLFVVVICCATQQKESNILDEVIERGLRRYKVDDIDSLSDNEQLKLLIKILQNNQTSRELIENEDKNLGFVGYAPTLTKMFSCQTFTKKDRSNVAKNVNELTPADIDVVGAIGDSLSAGTAIDAKNIFGLVNQYRGRVFSMGGDSSFEDGNPTLVNILRKYNPNVKGFSVGQGNAFSENAALNVAVPGHTSLDLLPQAKDLVNKMRSKLSKDEFQNSWKLITIFLGNNDIGGYCKDKYKGKFSPELYRQRLTETFDYLRANLPRTLVSVVKILDVYLVKHLNIGLVCSTLHKQIGRCAAYPEDEAFVEKMNKDYQEVTDAAVNNGNYFNDPNFTVVVQPFFKNTQLPRTSDNQVDLSYFAPDCFHFNGKGHAATALALWNSLFQSVGNKRTDWNSNEGYECPDPKNPVIKTRNNSV